MFEHSPSVGVTPSRWFGVLAAIGMLALGVLLVQIVDGSLPQLRMALSGGYAGSGGPKLKLFFAIAVGLAFAIVGLTRGTHSLLAPWLVFVAYLLILLPLHEARGINESIVSFISFVDTYGFIFLLPLAMSLCGALPAHWLVRCVVVLSVPLCALGIAQFVTSTPIVRPFSIDGQFMVNSWTMGGQARGFSLFTSGLRFGYFLALAIPLLWLLVVRSQGGKRIVCAVVCSLAVAALAATLTRNAYLMVAQGLITAVMLGRMTSVRFVPLIHLAISLAVTVMAALVGGGRSAGAGVASGESLEARMNLWAQYAHLWLETDVFTLLFGAGISQFSRFSAGEVVIDNLFLATGAQVGLVGLILFMWLLWSLWDKLVECWSEDRSNIFLAGCLCFWSTFLSAGVLNNSAPIHLTFFFLAILGVSRFGGQGRGLAREHLWPGSPAFGRQ